MKGFIEGIILWGIFVGIIFFIGGCHEEPMTEPPVMKEDTAVIEHEIIQEYPLITTADLEELGADTEEDALDKGQEVIEQTPIEEEAPDTSAEWVEEDTWEEEEEEEYWEEEPVEEEWTDEEPVRDENLEEVPIEEPVPEWEEEAIEEETIEEEAEMVDAVEEESGMVYLGNYQITAYEWTGNPCANGNYPTEGYTVACNSLPMGTVVYIEGVGYRTVEDRGATWHSDQWIDLYLGGVDECFSWGVKYLDVWVVE